MKKKLLSGITSVALLFQAIVTPIQAAAVQPSVPFAALQPPARVGTMVSTFVPRSKQATQKLPDVILIQDLHFNYSVQKNIAQLLQFLGKKDSIGSKIAVEGAVGEVDNSLLTDVANLKVREELADFLMQNGELTGSQYYSVVSGQPKVLAGVEDAAFFQANRDIFRLSYEPRMQAGRKLHALVARLRSLTSTHYSRPVRYIDRLQQRFESGTLNAYDISKALLREGQKANIDAPRALSQLLNASAEPLEPAQISTLYRSISDYALSLQIALAKSDMERHLAQLIAEFSLAERAVAQHATLDEIRYMASRLENTARLIRLVDRGASPLNVNEVLESLRSCIDFYVAALMRNQPMLDNALALRAKGETPSKPVVMILGGFHTPYFTKTLQDKGLSYVVYQPQAESHTATDEALYAKRFLGQRMTPSEVLAWITAHGGNRGSPKADAAGLVPPLAGIASWLRPFARAAERSGSIYGKEPGRFIEDLLSRERSIQSKAGTLLRVESLEDLKDPAFADDTKVPGGNELKSLLALQMKISGAVDSTHPTFPVKEFEFIQDQDLTVVRNTDGSVVSKDKWALKDRRTFIAIVPIAGKPSTYKAYIHVDAIKNNPTFKKNPFVFWAKFMLHELAEFGMNGNSVSHEVLAKAGLDADGDPNISLKSLLRKFSAYIPSLKQEWIHHYGRRAEADFADKAWRYIREQRVTRPDLTMESLTSEDIAIISSFGRRFGKKPAEEFWPATHQDIDEVRVADISEDAKHAAIEAQLRGHVIDQIYAGGNASRMKAGLEKSGVFPVLTPVQRHAIYFLPPSMALDNRPESIHWGGRALLRLNQSIRRLARENPGIGISEDAALKNRHIILHANEHSYVEMQRDLFEHDFYGFQPEHVYILVSGTYHMLVFDKSLGLWIEGEDAASESVLGNGVPTEMLVQSGQALRGSSQGTFVFLEADMLSLLMAVMKDQTNSSSSTRLILKQWRINDLKLWDPNLIDITRTAYVISRIKKGIFNLFEMVINPPLIEESGDAPKYQKGGLPMVVKINGQTRLMLPDKLSVADPESASMVNLANQAVQEKGLNPLVNEMAGFSDVEALAQSLRYGMPIEYESKKGKFIEPQYVTGETSFDLDFPSAFFRVEGTYLEDWKQYSHSQEEVARLKLAKMDSDPEFLALAAFYNFDVRPVMLRGRVSDEELLGTLRDLEIREYHTVDVRNVGKLQDIRARFKQTEDRITMQQAALRPTEAIGFLGIASALSLGAMAISPSIALAMLPWLIAALGQEIAVIAKAISVGNWRVLLSRDPIALYDFDSQTEDVNGVPSIARTFAHAHELARAFTQSRSALSPRLIAPLMLAYAILDDMAALILRAVSQLIAGVTGNAMPDTQTERALVSAGDTIDALLQPVKTGSAPQASQSWTGLWKTIQIGSLAVWKNSNARKEAAELAARQALAAAA